MRSESFLRSRIDRRRWVWFGGLDIFQQCARVSEFPPQTIGEVYPSVAGTIRRGLNGEPINGKAVRARTTHASHP